MNKFLRLIFIRVEKQRLQKKMDRIYDDYRKDVPEDLQKMNELQKEYNKLYQEEQELRSE